MNFSKVSLVPWIDSGELRTVGKSLLSAVELTESPNSGHSSFAGISLEESLRRVESWKSRSSHTLPASVESTAALSLAIWREFGSCSNHDLTAPTFLQTELRMMYSCAILRTINGLSDPFQQNRHTMASVAQICSQIGVPSWLVDLRHEATHNQLPSLSILRLGAVSLLKYLQSAYWDPLEAQIKRDEEKIWTCLEGYLESLSRPKNEDDQTLPKPRTSNKNPVKVRDSNSSRKEYFDFGSSSEDDSLGNETMEYFSFHGRVGTSCNMFSVLRGDKKSKKRKQMNVTDTSESTTSTKKKKIQRKDLVQYSSEDYLEQLFNTKIPLDTAWYTMQQFFLHGSTAVNGEHSKTGHLVPLSSTDYPCTEDGIEKLRQKFSALLSRLGTLWPGFIRSLFVNIVECIINLENDNSDATKQRKLFFLESWIKFLLSQSFVVSCGVTILIPSISGKVPAPLNALTRFNYPLNSLSDRLEAYCLPDSDCSVLHRILSLFLKILGKNRVLHRGMQKCATRSPSRTTAPETGGIQNEQDCGSAEVGQDLSLAQIEAMLDQDSIPLPDTCVQTTTPNSSAWTRCKAWEPCAIGTLPEFPM